MHFTEFEVRELLVKMKEDALLAVSGANLQPGIHQRLATVFDAAIGAATSDAPRKEEEDDGA